VINLINIEQNKSPNGNDNNITLILLALYIVLKPFYIFPSGIPQIADLVLVMIICLTFYGEIKIKRYHYAFIISGILFISYTILVNGIWGIFLGGGIHLLKSSAFYIFNFLVSLIIIINFAKNKNLGNYLYKGTLISVIIQFVLLLLNFGVSYRATNFFNNPNQLGYYALVSFALLIITGRTSNKNSVLHFTAIIGSFILVLASLSKAAIISFILMYLFYIFLEGKKGYWINLLFTLLLCLLLFFPGVSSEMNFLKNSDLYIKVEQRFLTIGKDGDDNIGGRGYDRIKNHPEYTLFGAGEGEYSRFDTQIRGMEMHSTFGSLFFSYGLVGFTLFLILLYNAIKFNRLVLLYPFIFIMIYGLTHNGIRNTFLWILLALLSTSFIPKDQKDINEFI
jgi:hypothetical protein